MQSQGFPPPPPPRPDGSGHARQRVVVPAIWQAVAAATATGSAGSCGRTVRGRAGGAAHGRGRARPPPRGNRGSSPRRGAGGHHCRCSAPIFLPRPVTHTHPPAPPAVTPTQDIQRVHAPPARGRGRWRRGGHHTARLGGGQGRKLPPRPPTTSHSKLRGLATPTPPPEPPPFDPCCHLCRLQL